MAILFHNPGFDPQPWLEALGCGLPGIPIRLFPDVGKPADIEYAVIWNHPHGDLQRYPNLKAVLLLSAGADFLKDDPALPRHIPIVRLIDENVQRDMAQHCLHFVLHFHRLYHRNSMNQRSSIWQRYDYPPAAERRIGILGLGEMGRAIASQLLKAGLPVQAWVRTPRNAGTVSLFVGEQRLKDFFQATDILINVLPNTAQTVGFLDNQRLHQMPQGSFLINVGRGSTVNDDALREALDSGRLEAAALDVFREEPLPADNWMWTHPGMVITPHAAGNTYAHSGARKIIKNIRRIQRGKPPSPLFDPLRGY